MTTLLIVELSIAIGDTDNGDNGDNGSADKILTHKCYCEPRIKWLSQHNNTEWRYTQESAHINRLYIPTTSKEMTGLGKLGFSSVSLIGSERTTVPPHSSSTRGEVTLSSWYRFMSRTPQHRICRQGGGLTLTMIRTIHDNSTCSQNRKAVYQTSWIEPLIEGLIMNTQLFDCA